MPPRVQMAILEVQDMARAVIGGGMIRLEFLGDLPFLTNTVLGVVIAFGYIMLLSYSKVEGRGRL